MSRGDAHGAGRKPIDDGLPGWGVALSFFFGAVLLQLLVLGLILDQFGVGFLVAMDPAKRPTMGGVLFFALIATVGLAVSSYIVWQKFGLRRAWAKADAADEPP